MIMSNVRTPPEPTRYLHDIDVSELMLVGMKRWMRGTYGNDSNKNATAPGPFASGEVMIEST
jgi:hypothetical protein